MARDLRELELQGILECRDGAWQLVAGVETKETEDGRVIRVPQHRRTRKRLMAIKGRRRPERQSPSPKTQQGK